MNIKYILGILFCIFHYTANFIILYILIFNNNFYVIMTITIFLFLVVFSWYFINDCILLSIENYLLDKKNVNHNYNNYLCFKLFNRKIYIFYHILYSYHSYFLPFMFIICCIKLIYIYNRDTKFNKKIK